MGKTLPYLTCTNCGQEWGLPEEDDEDYDEDDEFAGCCPGCGGELTADANPIALALHLGLIDLEDP